jgi:hypothetical protein
MDFTKLCWTLQESKLHFHRIGDFSDHFEGAMPVALRELFVEGFRQAIEEVDSWEFEGDDFESHMEGEMEKVDRMERMTTFANCWHANDSESAALWEGYRADGKPVAIVSSIGGLIESLSSVDHSVRIGTVEYVNHYTRGENLDEKSRDRLMKLIDRVDGSVTYQQTLTKRKEFEFENEVRAVITDTEGYETEEDGGIPISQFDRSTEAHKDYINVEIELSELVDKIVLAPDTPDYFHEAVTGFIEDSDTPLDSDDVDISMMDQKPWKSR